MALSYITIAVQRSDEEYYKGYHGANIYSMAYYHASGKSEVDLVSKTCNVDIHAPGKIILETKKSFLQMERNLRKKIYKYTIEYRTLENIRVYLKNIKNQRNTLIDNNLIVLYYDVYCINILCG